MLGTMVRGVFLIGFLGWYSTSMWGMIDNYFREQFRQYLDEEYRKNPQMRMDVEREAAGEKPNSGAALSETPKVEETNIVDKTDFAVNSPEADGSVGKLDTPPVPEDGKTSPEQRDRANRRHGSEVSDGAADTHSPIREMSGSARVPRKSRDRRTVKPRRIAPRTDDFWEFEEERGSEPPVGVPVADLPIRPRYLADLERVSAEEFCPLVPDEEESCGRTVRWP